MVTSTDKKANTLDISLSNVTLEIPSTVPVNGGENASTAPVNDGENASTVPVNDGENELQDDAKRTSPEGSASRTPVGTPALNKRVQFADPDDVYCDPEESHDEITIDDDDDDELTMTHRNPFGDLNDSSDNERPRTPPLVTDIYRRPQIPPPDTDIYRRPQTPPPDTDIYRCETEEDLSRDQTPSPDDTREHVHFSDDVTDNEGKSAFKESYHGGLGTKQIHNGNMINIDNTNNIQKQPNGNGLIKVNPKDNRPPEHAERSSSSRCRWSCCCGIGWSSVGAIAITTGILLVLYLKQYWKSHDRESVLLYYGIGACILGGLSLLVGLGFWTYSCIIWTPKNSRKDDEQQTNDSDPSWPRKTKYVVNTETRNSDTASAMPHDPHPEYEDRTIDPGPITSDTFMI